MKKINTIYQKLLNQNEKIVYKAEIIGTIKEFNKKFNSSLDIGNTIKYLTRHDYIRRVFLGYYYINSFDERKGSSCDYEDKEILFLTLNKLNLRWYVGLSYALYILGENWQLPNTLSILNNKFSGQRSILGMRVRFYKIREKLIFGLIRTKTTNNVLYKYSSHAKTYLDIVYLRINNKLVRTRETSKYLRRYPPWVGRI